MVFLYYVGCSECNASYFIFMEMTTATKRIVTEDSNSI